MDGLVIDECLCVCDCDRWMAGDGWLCKLGGLAIDGYEMVENMFCGDVCGGTKGGEVTRLEPQDLSVTFKLGLGLCSRLPSKIDNQTDRCNTQ
jgi:hypothetical protein